jgi:hypothetical protein
MQIVWIERGQFEKIQGYRLDKLLLDKELSRYQALKILMNKQHKQKKRERRLQIKGKTPANDTSG